MGGKFFIDKNGVNPCSRIPTEDLGLFIDDVIAEFSKFFDKMEVVTCQDLLPKENHGDVDFVCLISGEQRNQLREHVKAKPLFKIGHNGPMEHIAFPFYSSTLGKAVFYQVDLIFAGSKTRYDTILYFYSRPTVFNSVVGQFARALGYIFSTNGFYLLVKDARKQNRKILLTEDLEVAYDIMKLPPFKDEEIFKSPKDFAAWIQSSPRFDSKKFVSSHNVKSHRDARRDVWCQEVYDILDTCGQVSDIPVHFVDFTEDEDLDVGEAMKYEVGILGERTVDYMMEQLRKFKEVKKQVLSGDVLIEMGYPQGKMIGQILKKVAENFTVDDPEEDKIMFVKDQFPNE